MQNKGMKLLNFIKGYLNNFKQNKRGFCPFLNGIICIHNAFFLYFDFSIRFKIAILTFSKLWLQGLHNSLFFPYFLNSTPIFFPIFSLFIPCSLFPCGAQAPVRPQSLKTSKVLYQLLTRFRTMLYLNTRVL